MGAIVARMDAYAEGDEFRRYMDSLIDATDDTGSDRLIADTSEIPPLDQDDQQWSVVDWAPRAERAGLEHMALVTPESVVSEMSTETVVEMADDTINRELFDELEDAKTWVGRQ